MKFAVIAVFSFFLLFLSGCTSISLSPVNFFRNYISPIDGSRCPMHPSCSAYSVEAINKHGSLLGLIMTFDRLMRCGRDEITKSDTIRIDDNYYCNDPVLNNDFWYGCMTHDSAQSP